MKYRAIVKQSGGWWIGWLVDLPGVNAQERSREQVIESLRVGAQDILATQVPFESDAAMIVVDVAEPAWSAGSTSA